MKNLLQFTINVRKTSPSTSVHFATRVWRSRVVRLSWSSRFFMRAAASKIRASNSFRVSTFEGFILSVTFCRRVRAVAKKVPITFRHVRSPYVRPSVRMYHLGYHRTDFCKFRYWGLLWKSANKIKILLKSGKHIDHFTWKLKYVSLLRR
jgi:hypothetical protein